MLVAFGTQHAVGMRRITLSYVACMAVRYFSTFSGKRHDFQESNAIEYKMYVSTFSTASVLNILRYKKK